MDIYSKLLRCIKNSLFTSIAICCIFIGYFLSYETTRPGEKGRKNKFCIHFLKEIIFFKKWKRNLFFLHWDFFEKF